MGQMDVCVCLTNYLTIDKCAPLSFSKNNTQKKFYPLIFVFVTNIEAQEIVLTSKEIELLQVQPFKYTFFI